MTAPRVFVAGHKGMVGAAIMRAIRATHPTATLVVRSRQELDLTRQSSVERFFNAQQIDHVYLAAAKVGGIMANNSFPAQFIRENLVIQSNVIHSAYISGVNKLLFLGSSCIYPKDAEQPIREEYLLSGTLESTNEPYAIAKIAGIKMCESYNRQYGVDYRSVMPTNLYGSGDNFHPENSHVIPGLIRRFHEAKLRGQKSVLVWGTGLPMREFLHVDDMADACVHIMQIDRSDYAASTGSLLSHINVGTGEDVTIKELAELIAEIVGYEGTIAFDPSRPDGTPRKLLDVGRIHALGWKHTTGLREGLQRTYRWFVQNQQGYRG